MTASARKDRLSCFTPDLDEAIAARRTKPWQTVDGSRFAIWCRLNPSSGDQKPGHESRIEPLADLNLERFGKDIIFNPSVSFFPKPGAIDDLAIIMPASFGKTTGAVLLEEQRHLRQCGPLLLRPSATARIQPGKKADLGRAVCFSRLPSGNAHRGAQLAPSRHQGKPARNSMDLTIRIRGQDLVQEFFPERLNSFSRLGQIFHQLFKKGSRRHPMVCPCRAAQLS
ncbi:MAG: hypothetical protein HQL97_14685 [Magnetococcales bacterium]|nr:hypothetical protein [Magnetococcales bacterium]